MKAQYRLARMNSHLVKQKTGAQNDVANARLDLRDQIRSHREKAFIKFQSTCLQHASHWAISPTGAVFPSMRSCFRLGIRTFFSTFYLY
ncbi:hypothetical protein MHU86_2196 [Fragilaria crotonensis]|nr:hypothetical protein MHU86_2196 [Fragilaria crotonensis]